VTPEPTVDGSALACNDLVDNDGDGSIDYLGIPLVAPADSGCTSPLDSSE
jgi:hypothetical protein